MATPLGTILGCRVGGTNETKWSTPLNRQSLSSPILSEEAYLTQQLGQTFVFGATRYYSDMYSAIGNDWDNDNAKNRLTCATFKMGSGHTWRDGSTASSSVQSDLYNHIVSRGNEIKALQTARAGSGNKWDKTIVIGLHHEPNDSDQTDILVSGTSDPAQGIAYWQGMYENVFTIWKNMGISFWSGTWSGGVFTTTTPGIIVCTNLTGGVPSPNSDDYNTWMPTSWTWGWNNIIMPAIDAYDQPSKFKSFRYHTGYVDGTTNHYHDWVQRKLASQQAAGKTLLPAIFETGVLDFGDYSSIDTSWTNDYPSISASAPHWFSTTLDYVKANWPDLFLYTYWDSQSLSTKDWKVDESSSKLGAFVAFCGDASWNTGTDAIPSSGGGGSSGPLVRNWFTGTNGSDVTQAQTATSGDQIDSVVNGAGNTMRYTTVAAELIKGTSSVKIIPTTGTISYVEWNALVGDQAVMFGRAYFLWPALPTASAGLMNILNSTTQLCGRVGINTSGQLTAVPSGGSAVGTMNTAIQAGHVFRVEYRMVLDPTVGEIEVRLFKTNPDADVTSYDERLLFSPATGNPQNMRGTGSKYRAGLVALGATVNCGPVIFDDYALATSGWVGPSDTTTLVANLGRAVEIDLGNDLQTPPAMQLGQAIEDDSAADLPYGEGWTLERAVEID